MQELIIYLSKSAGLISLFYAGYFFFLKNDTSFKTNRIYLLAGILTSLLLPLLEITRTIEVQATAAPVFFEGLMPQENVATPTPNAEINWWQAAGIIYLIGLGFFLLKFFFEIFSLLKLLVTHKSNQQNSYNLIEKPGTTQPFSFFKYIVFDPAHHSPAELELILKHERSHARQWHSVDQLLTSLCIYLLWVNPLAWLYKKSVVQNLEYLADKEVLTEEVSKKAYQKTLLKISVSNYRPALTNQFYQSFIKKRIIMLNQNNTQKSNFWKTSLLLPFMAVFIFSFNIKTEAKEVMVQEEPEISNVEVSFYVTKASDKKTLKTYSRLFKQRGIELKFEDLEYSDGLLTNVKVTFTKEADGTSGTLSLSNPQGISPLFIHTDGKEVTMTPEAVVPEESNDPNPLAGVGKEPLYVIEGKEYNASQLWNKHVQVKGDWQVLKPRDAVKKFGKKAKDGAIVIAQENIVEDFKEALKSIDLSQMPMQQTFIHVKENGYPMLVSVDSKRFMHGSSQPTNFEKQDISFHKKPEDIIAVQEGEDKSRQFYTVENEPLVVINGEVQEKGYDVSRLEVTSIKSLNVLKGEAALDKYGKGAKHGVIEITLKPDTETGSSDPEKTQEAKKQVQFSAHSMTFKDSERKRLSVRDVGSADPDASRPLYVVDGKIMAGDFDLDSISKENIGSVTVLKGESATEKYGEKASNGVIEITTKK